ncbi:unnamed protein product [Ectocarpus sp. 12 AP-2014]
MFGDARPDPSSTLLELPIVRLSLSPAQLAVLFSALFFLPESTALCPHALLSSCTAIPPTVARQQTGGGAGQGRREESLPDIYVQQKEMKALLIAEASGLSL